MRSYIPEEFKKEILEIIWLTDEKAIERCTYPNTKELVREIISYVNRKDYKGFLAPRTSKWM